MSFDTQMLSGLGVRTVQDAQSQSKDKSKLGQEDFMALMIAQLRNQDPMKPMENGDFLGQIAQFSQVSGLQDLQKSFDELSTSLVSNQALQAASLVGRDVLAPTGLGELAQGGSIRGDVELPSASPQVSVKIYDDAGQVVRTLELGSQASGAALFQWDGLRDDGTYAQPGTYLVSATAEFNGKNEAVEANIVNRVNGVTLGNNGGLLLDLAGVGPLEFTEVKQIL